jgi:uncharacterized protein (TIGR02996 family)
MSEADAFVAAVLAAPDDDAPRLRYADWLEERGNAASAARAELIRIQIALERLPDDAAEWLPLMRRESELLDACRAVWERPLLRAVRPPLTWPLFRVVWSTLPVCWCQFSRGFVESLVTGGGNWRALGDSPFRHAPIRHVSLWGVEVEVPALSQDPAFDGVASLHLYPREYPGPGGEAVLRFAAQEARLLLLAFQLPTSATEVAGEMHGARPVGDMGHRPFRFLELRSEWLPGDNRVPKATWLRVSREMEAAVRSPRLRRTALRRPDAPPLVRSWWRGAMYRPAYEVPLPAFERWHARVYLGEALDRAGVWATASADEFTNARRGLADLYVLIKRARVVAGEVEKLRESPFYRGDL